MFVTQLKSFFWVARLGSITQAARQLGLSQPTVTAQIKALEELHEVELFTRQSGRLAITDAGLKLLPQIEQLLLQTAQIESSLRQSGTVQQGQLRIGATAPYYVLDIVKRYQATLPLVDISIQSGNSRQMIQSLAEYQVDLATSSHLDTDPRLLRIELGRDPLALVVHAQHPLAQTARKGKIKFSDLATDTLILRERGSMTRQLTEQMLEAAKVTPNKILEIASRESIREAVIRQMGISVFARHEASAHPDLVVLELEGEVPTLPEYLYCLRERRSSQLIQPFLQMAESLK
ncbi:LysR family transcriptional regulator [Comamonas testosteroni]|uniref:LysR family transcriptional regulator n=1 Tax=Comamonas testosteroni TaxID=285 RepID=A0A373FQ76_COMTE|nr:LysR substrate-binding domain-containing protein [Comamonas testosteroni]RGE46037.1 LysR family transcriptional regulator [Comamonas testosteroni]